ncbi:Ca2+-binding protein, RTX toxin-related [Roseivivax marinus]|uniref:hypothetical protein n=1 Tax=Roseivivax marinus TaxID=1379903 RepID=UPI0008CD287F|nr:hypothetical protein [Roseivivax marinus]SEK59515.1 Ca2+-binding protein, RTX toxin-related [Roseivivax marinus]
MTVDIYAPTSSDSLSLTELDLYHMIMDYRAASGLPAIPLSQSLTTVAGRHTLDSYHNIEAAGVSLPSGYSSPSWIHSWSDAYYDGSDSSVMRDAPSRLGTGYPGGGYEISVAGAQSIRQTLDMWIDSPGHNQLLVNLNSYSDDTWNAIGVGVGFNAPVSGGSFTYGNYFHVWFGKVADPAGPPVIDGTNAGELIEMTNFADEVRDRGGNDTVIGYSGNDTFYVGGGANDFRGGDGTDRAVIPATFAQVTATVDGSVAQITLNGTTSTYRGIEVFAFSDGTTRALGQLNGGTSGGDRDGASDGGGVGAPQEHDQEAVDLFPVSSDRGETGEAGGSGGEGQEMIGTDAGDEISGTSADDTIAGQGGHDMLSAGGGNDNISGSDGNDTISAGSGHDNVGGGLGNDEIWGAGGNDTIGAGRGNDYVNAGPGNDVANGGQGDDMIFGEDGDDTTGAGFGDDTVAGGSGHDSLGGGTGQDMIAGHGGNDAIGGGEGNDSISGGDGNDFLAGGGRDDVIYGGSGADTINGGDGNDALYGGTGADVFVWNEYEAGATDTIYGFQDGVDTLRLADVSNAPGTGLAGKLDALNITDIVVDGVAGVRVGYQGNGIEIPGLSAAQITLDDIMFL